MRDGGGSAQQGEGGLLVLHEATILRGWANGAIRFAYGFLLFRTEAGSGAQWVIA